MPAFLLKAVLVWLAVINLIAFALMGLDKQKARRDAWRIPEKTLFLAALLGGALGGTVGMHLFHHKTRHWYFRFGFPVLLILQLLLAGFLAYRFG